MASDNVGYAEHGTRPRRDHGDQAEPRTGGLDDDDRGGADRLDRRAAPDRDTLDDTVAVAVDVGQRGFPGAES